MSLILKTIVDFAIFLEFTGDDDLNPDFAVEAMEQLAAELQLLNKAEKLSLISEFKNLAKNNRGQTTFFIRT